MGGRNRKFLRHREHGEHREKRRAAADGADERGLAQIGRSVKKSINFAYDTKVYAAYLSLKRFAVVKLDVLAAGILVDLVSFDQVVGVELLHSTKRVRGRVPLTPFGFSRITLRR